MRTLTSLVATLTAGWIVGYAAHYSTYSTKKPEVQASKPQDEGGKTDRVTNAIDNTVDDLYITIVAKADQASRRRYEPGDWFEGIWFNVGAGQGYSCGDTLVIYHHNPDRSIENKELSISRCNEGVLTVYRSDKVNPTQSFTQAHWSVFNDRCACDPDITVFGLPEPGTQAYIERQRDIRSGPVSVYDENLQRFAVEMRDRINHGAYNTHK